MMVALVTTALRTLAYNITPFALVILVMGMKLGDFPRVATKASPCSTDSQKTDYQIVWT
jgi:hypothetical protein